MKNILEITRNLGIDDKFIIPYGWDKAKIDLKYMDELKDRPDGKLVLVTAITPTKAGEGKTTTTIGLHDGLHKIGINSLACLREPSLGPVWGIKGGAVGALKSTIIPSDDINLHLTGDLHALTATINLISAIIENHIYQGNELNINPDRIVWSRALDISDRSLREITVALGDKKATPHKSEFVITVASELMTIYTFAQSEQEFIDRVNNIIVAYTYDEKPVYFREFNCSKAILKMMKTALNPNIVQTLEENPVLLMAGPFANLSAGVSSISATKLALKLAPIVCTEAGFSYTLGGEKFMDIKCRLANIHPNVVVLVATARALKLHGGVKFEDIDLENSEAISIGICNLKQHYENIRQYGIPVIIAINRFPSDTESELKVISDWCDDNNIMWSLNSAALDGSDGSVDLATKVTKVLELQEQGELDYADNFKYLYKLEQPIVNKIDIICKNIYHADGVEYTALALEQIKKYEEMGYRDLPICISKTQSSFSDDPKLLGAPRGFKIHIRDVKLYSGAGLIVPLSGTLITMPGLPKEPRCLDKFN